MKISLDQTKAIETNEHHHPLIPGQIDSNSTERKKSEIEYLFNRTPKPQEVFHPFSPQEYSACQEEITQNKNFTQTSLPDNTFEALTAIPPRILDPQKTNHIDQISYWENFLNAANQCGKNLINIAAQNTPSHHEILICPVWRAGLAFTETDVPAKFWHMGLSRNPQTLQSEVYFSGESNITDPQNTTVFIADPMIGTGNTIFTVLKEVMAKGIPEQNITLVSFTITPEGAARLSRHFPNIKFVSSFTEVHLDKNGWIIPNDENQFLGDFGDDFTKFGLTPKKVAELVQNGILNEEEATILKTRLNIQSTIS